MCDKLLHSFCIARFFWVTKTEAAHMSVKMFEFPFLILTKNTGMQVLDIKANVFPFLLNDTLIYKFIKFLSKYFLKRKLKCFVFWPGQISRK